MWYRIASMVTERYPEEWNLVSLFIKVCILPKGNAHKLRSRDEGQ